jgi:hypothetical protein
MHTARQLDVSMFGIKINGQTATREDVLPGWGVNDRIGVVMLEPYGAVGATMLMQLAITAFYDVRPSRRDGNLGRGPRGERDERAIYPELFVFHVGGCYGNLSGYDAWPSRKEVFLENDPRVVLDAINDRAITRLAVPDGIERPVRHAWKEPAAARDRIVSAFTYGADGHVAHPDLAISGLTPKTEANVDLTLDVERTIRRGRALDPGEYGDEDLMRRSWGYQNLQRADEGSEGRARAVERRQALRGAGAATEHYRRISVDQALALLVNPGWELQMSETVSDAEAVQS